MLKPPCLIFHEFLSPLKSRDCNRDLYINAKFDGIKAYIENYYDINIKTVSTIIESSDINLTCDNSFYKHGKWILKNHYDFTCYIPLMNHNNHVPFDDEYDVYGGELIFPNFKKQLSLNIGDLLIFPSCPNFIHHHNKPMIGYFKYINFFITAEKRFEYDYKQWDAKAFLKS